MRRYWADRIQVTQGELLLTGELHHHIFQVCRTVVGEKFELLDVHGQAHLVEVLQVGRREARVRALSSRALPALPRPHIHLVLSVPRFPKLDEIVEKSVELGVYALHPVVSDHSFVRRVSEVPENRWQRWGKIVKQAAQQSARGTLMQVSPVRGLGEVVDEVVAEINQNPRAAGLFPFEGECRRSLRQELKSLHERGPLEQVWVMVGSEGGFSANEVKLMRERGLEPLTLGEQVLRVETACVALVSIIKYELAAP